jgi:Spy/CpxP family protein refolding chaperone
MIRSIALGLLVAVAGAGLGAFSSPAWAADPADEQAKPAKRPETRLWWNDPAIVEKLSLSGEQRAQMDQLFGTYLSERKNAARSSNARKPFLEALEQGDMERARSKLDSWAEGERAGVQAGGKLKIEGLSLLSDEQRKALASAYPRLIRKSWVPRPSWEPAPSPKRPVGKKQQEEPAN